MKHVKVITLLEYKVDVVVLHVEDTEGDHRLEISTWYEYTDTDGEVLEALFYEERPVKTPEIAIQMVKDFSSKSAVAFLFSAGSDEGIEIETKS